ncbi:alpha-tocopherol transfer protein-like [Pectinophora gossypiella]|uniref:alpha-tocopherol transfer protein-like n=1 Tax=Pectinophora gossypiella TaxID=13191 RepID=UPI00214EB4D9|nr:alpha-tocopherol transfer protein-like [Pectinophora gossypiella]XP_049878960.1 alpha-tocopherol transfer protein-like [Pectinophora gossypiella]
MSCQVAKQFPLEEEYKKNTGISPADIAKLRAWLKTQPHLPEEHITDLDLILVYHCCGRSSEVSKQLIDLHFTLRTLFTSFFKDRFYDDKMKFVHQHVALMAPLPTHTSEGYTVFYAGFTSKDPKVFVLNDCYRATLMRLDLWQYEEGSWPGWMLVLDLDGMTLGHLAKIDVHSVQQFLYYLQEAILVNLKGLHFLNAPSFMDRLMMLIRPFMKKSLMDMMGIHQVGSTTFDKIYPIEQLPSGVCGGKGISKEQLLNENLAKLEAGKDYFIQENKKRVTESLRPGKPKTITDIFGGIEGSFKKLDID